jgi:hypothetical protein
MAAARSAEPVQNGRERIEGNLAPIPRIALTRADAAASLGMSVDSFERYVQPTIRLLRLGRMVLVPVAELERWVDEHAGRTVP